MKSAVFLFCLFVVAQSSKDFHWLHIPNGIIINGTITNGTITNGTITNGTMNHRTLDKRTITKENLNIRTVINGTITNGTITYGTITNGTITNSTRARRAIMNGAIINGTLTNGTVINGTISKQIISNGAITIVTITNGTLTNVTVTNGTITNGTIINGTVIKQSVSNKTSTIVTITNGVITNVTVTNGTVSKENHGNRAKRDYRPNEVELLKLREIAINGTITNGTITNGTITNGTMNHQTLDKRTITKENLIMRTVINGTITNGTITNGTITNGTIINSTRARRAIMNGAITNGTLTNGTIINGTISKQIISNGAITIVTITNGTLTNVTVTNGTITNGTIINGTVFKQSVSNKTSTIVTITNGAITNVTVTNGTVNKGNHGNRAKRDYRPNEAELSKLREIARTVLPIDFSRTKSSLVVGAYMNKALRAIADGSYENWMRELPESIQNMPMSGIAIPGSHDSFAASLDASEIGPTPGLSDGILNMINLLGVGDGGALNVIYNWAVTQDFPLTLQLKSGIRYLDFRVAPRKSRNGELYLLHSLFAQSVKKALTEVKDFLDAHEKEVVIIDIQKLYEMSAADHTQLISDILSYFGDRMVPVKAWNELTLANIWSEKQQVILIYQDAAGSDSRLWRSEHITSTWLQTNDVNTAIAKLDNEYNQGHQPEQDGFRVSQGVLTAQPLDIITGIGSSLRDKLGLPMCEATSKWVLDKKIGSGGLNIVITDFVENYDFIGNVIKLNYKS